MLTTKPTLEMIAEWKDIYETQHLNLKPNRRTGSEIDRYFHEKYPCQVFDNLKFKKIVELNITENEFSNRKLPKGVEPNIKSYKIGDILVGIDLISGEFHVESKNINEAIPIYDDLYIYRGLDEEDLKNFFLVAEYIKLTAK